MKKNIFPLICLAVLGVQGCDQSVGYELGEKACNQIDASLIIPICENNECGRAYYYQEKVDSQCLKTSCQNGEWVFDKTFSCTGSCLKNGGCAQNDPCLNGNMRCTVDNQVEICEYGEWRKGTEVGVQCVLCENGQPIEYDKGLTVCDSNNRNVLVCADSESNGENGKNIWKLDKECKGELGCKNYTLGEQDENGGQRTSNMAVCAECNLSDVVYKNNENGFCYQSMCQFGKWVNQDTGCAYSCAQDNDKLVGCGQCINDIESLNSFNEDKDKIIIYKNHKTQDDEFVFKDDNGNIYNYKYKIPIDIVIERDDIYRKTSYYEENGVCRHQICVGGYWGVIDDYKMDDKKVSCKLDGNGKMSGYGECFNGEISCGKLDGEYAKLLCKNGINTKIIGCSDCVDGECITECENNTCINVNDNIGMNCENHVLKVCANNFSCNAEGTACGECQNGSTTNKMHDYGHKYSSFDCVYQICEHGKFKDKNGCIGKDASCYGNGSETNPGYASCLVDGEKVSCLHDIDNDKYIGCGECHNGFVNGYEEVDSQCYKKSCEYGKYVRRMCLTTGKCRKGGDDKGESALVGCAACSEGHREFREIEKNGNKYCQYRECVDGDYRDYINNPVPPYTKFTTEDPEGWFTCHDEMPCARKNNESDGEIVGCYTCEVDPSGRTKDICTKVTDYSSDPDNPQGFYMRKLCVGGYGYRTLVCGNDSNCKMCN